MSGKKRIIIDGQERVLKIVPAKLGDDLAEDPLKAIVNFVKTYGLKFHAKDLGETEIELTDKIKINVKVKHIYIRSFIDAKYQGRDDSEIFTRAALDLQRKFYDLVIDQKVFDDDYNYNKFHECQLQNLIFKK